MPSYSVELGKGWREPCSPYRSGTVFGAALNTPYIPTLNCNPEIVNPITTLDLSQLAPYLEAILCLAKVYGAPVGYYSGSSRWYRERDNALLFTYSWPPQTIDPARFYFYSYIGYVPHEINENGSYRCEVEVLGPYSFTATARFSVSGIPEEPPPPEPIGAGLVGVLEAFGKASAWCHTIYLQVLDWVWPFRLLANPFYYLSTIFMGAARATGEFNTWVLTLASQVSQVLSWEGIKGLIRDWLKGIEAVLAWFSYWQLFVESVFLNLWLTVQQTIRGWIAAATQGLADLRASWDNFSTSVLPNLVSLTWLTAWWSARLLDIQSLINSAFTIRDSLWSGWSTWRDSVAEFFANPVQYVWSRFIDWFLGPEGR